MFERYTEKARRAIFFSRYEASHYGSVEIDTEHLLLGLLRENKNLNRWLPKLTLETIRQCIDDCSPKRRQVPTSEDLPLTPAARRVLKYAADEAELLAHKHIGTEHLLLALFDEQNCLAANLLRDAGADRAVIRTQLSNLAQQQQSHIKSIPGHEKPSVFASPIVIHGVLRNARHVRDAFQRCRMYNWKWHKRSWSNVDIVIEKNTGRVSFDLGLSDGNQEFSLVKGGWTRDHCRICHWELFESKNEADADHGTGWTNGRDWVCTECYDKFWDRPDFIAGSFGDMT